MFDATGTLAHDGLARPARLRRKPAEYRLYYAIVFAVALPIALVRCLVPGRPGWLDRSADQPRGPIAGARALADTVVPYLFMR